MDGAKVTEFAEEAMERKEAWARGRVGFWEDGLQLRG